ncbi:MAG: NADH-quinone oxidoreductase subunit D, partial [Actinomycetota bacterium]
MTTTENQTKPGEAEVAAAETSEGRQELQLRKDISTKEMMRGSGAVLRMSESEVASLAGVQS